MTTAQPRKRAARPGEGRPSKYDPAFGETLIHLMETEGLSIGAVAGAIGVSRDTILEWSKVHPEFSGAKKLGEAKAQLFWERELGKIARKGGGPGAATAGIFALKNRAQADWRDKQDHELNLNGKLEHGADASFLSLVGAMESLGRTKAASASGTSEMDSSGAPGADSA